MNNKVAGPTLRALIAANMGRILSQRGARVPGDLGDPGRSGVFHEDINGVRVTTTNHVKVIEAGVESRLTWDIVHPQWTLKFTERRQLDDDGQFERAAPYEVSLEGDLIDAARFLGLPKELFFGAARADGWSRSAVIIEGLRWIDGPYVQDRGQLNVILRLL